MRKVMGPGLAELRAVAAGQAGTIRLKPTAIWGMLVNQRQLRKENTMERREFLAALGTAATVAPASPVFAQMGGGGSVADHGLAKRCAI
jgi:hypothetical protein